MINLASSNSGRENSASPPSDKTALISTTFGGGGEGEVEGCECEEGEGEEEEEMNDGAIR